MNAMFLIVSNVVESVSPHAAARHEVWSHLARLVLKQAEREAQ